MFELLPMGLTLSWISYLDGTVGTCGFRSTHPNVARTMKTFNRIDINDAAIAAVKTFSPTNPDDLATCTTTNDSSAMCVNPVATAIAVFRE
jgi:hypothetical protein